MPILGYHNEDIAWLMENDRALFIENYPEYSYEALDSSVSEDDVFGDLEEKAWKAPVLFPMICRHEETEGEDNIGLAKDQLDLTVIFSTQILVDNAVDPKVGDRVIYSDGIKYEIMFIRLTDPIGNTGQFLHRLARCRRYDETRTYTKPTATNELEVGG